MNKKVIVIGAGASGFSAAAKLIENGWTNIKILEAENRIGGRINTVKFGENVLDMGAQWCHGEKGNVVYELAKNHNLLSSNRPKYESFLLIQSDGKWIAQNLSDKLVKLSYDIIEDREADRRLHKGSLGNFFMENYVNALKDPSYDDVDDGLRRQFVDFFHKFENSIEASDSWYDTSSSSLSDYWICDGDPLLNWKGKGYVTVFDLLQKEIPCPENSLDVINYIQFNKDVKMIKYDLEKLSKAIQIECSDGSLHEADHVICAVSLGVLKERYLSFFEPVLPQRKIDTIEGLSIGTVDKIYLEFEKPFWPPEWEGFSLLWKPEDLKVIREDSENSWLEDVFGFYKVSFQPNILCGWISGPNARRMEQATDDQVQAGVTRLLRLFLRNWTIPESIQIKRSRWYSNPHFRGSYTYYSMKSDALAATTTKLAEPLTDSYGRPVVQFAGEATSEHFYSTVHGAVESGWREAQRLIDFYRLKSQL